MGKPEIRFYRNGNQMVLFKVQHGVLPNPTKRFEYKNCVIFAEDLIPYGKRLYRGQRILVAGRLRETEYTVDKGKDKGQKRVAQQIIVEYMSAMVPLDQFGISPGPDHMVDRAPTEWEVNQHPDVYL